MGGSGLLLREMLVALYLQDAAGPIHIVASRDKLHFLYESDPCRCGCVKLLCIHREGRGAFDPLGYASTAAIGDEDSNKRT